MLDRADPDAGVVIVVTDGRANVADGSPVAATSPRRERSVKQPPRTIVVNAGEAGRAGLLDPLQRKRTPPWSSRTR